MALHDDERVARAVLRGQIPGLLQSTPLSADMQAFTLAEGVEGEALVGPEHFTFG